jgi:hypothetical protein
VAVTSLRNICPSCRNGVYEPFLAQDGYRTPSGGTRDLVRFDKLALGGDAGVRRVLARLDTALDDRRDLPIGRHRAEGIDPLSLHMINSRYRRLRSCIGIRIDTSRYMVVAIAPRVRELGPCPACYAARFADDARRA